MMSSCHNSNKFPLSLVLLKVKGTQTHSFNTFNTTIIQIIWDKDVAEGAVSKAVEVVLIPPHPVFIWMLLLILSFSHQ